MAKNKQSFTWVAIILNVLTVAMELAWILIYNRLKKFGQLDKLEVSNDDKGHKINLYPATINLKEEKANE